MKLSYLPGAAFILSALSASAADNPMWRNGLVWSCQFSSVIQCERSLDCATQTVSGTIDLDYRENHVIGQDDIVRPIKRHYVQTIPGSPISSEVKVELDSNEVLWLLPADGAGTFSDNWVGAIVSPKAGVVIQEVRPLVCKPRR